MAKKPVKSPIAIIRDMKTISEEYGTTCGKAGEAAYKIEMLKSEVKVYQKRMSELQLEHSKAAFEAERKAQAENNQETPAPEEAQAV